MKKPVPHTMDYLEFGFWPVRWHGYKCPDCGTVLNAGPDWQCKRCDECGLLIDWTDVVWLPKEDLK